MEGSSRTRKPSLLQTSWVEDDGVCSASQKRSADRYGSVRISVSGEVIPGAAQRGCPLFFVMQYARPDAIARVV